MTFLHLSAAGSSLLVSTHQGEAEIVHWGRALRRLPTEHALRGAVPLSALDVPVVAGVVPQASSGWRGRPGLRGSRGSGRGAYFSPRLRIREIETVGQRELRLVQSDDGAGLTVVSSFGLDESGLLQISHTVVNDGDDVYRLDELAITLPVPAEASEILDLAGRWCRERIPQRRRVEHGTWVRSTRHARTGHDSSLLFAAGTPAFANRRGEVWGIHFGWSGDAELFADTIADGRTMLGASELLGAGEALIQPGGAYTTPTLFAAHSVDGLDGLSGRFHEWFRHRDQHVTHPASGRVSRPVVLNTWEAVYFDHDLAALSDLAAAAAELGVERFVLDDGWFRGRRTDTVGLGDWYVDDASWPDGLSPLIDTVTSLGMDFGLWVEPEMINLDSDVARAHPDWIARPASDRMSEQWRSQQILDLVHPDAWQYVYDRLDALLRENDIRYLKWDQNRDSHELGHGGRPSVHAQTLAVYRLMDAVRAAHPDVEIESCSSGGARVDLGILTRTDRVWASDCNDALERQSIQRWTELVVPPEMIGAHVGAERSHTTGRVHDLVFRGITAMFGHFGLEMDVRLLTDGERDTLLRIIELYKEHRALLHGGDVVHADLADESLQLRGVVAREPLPEGEVAALFSLARLVAAKDEVPGKIPLPGLNPNRTYLVETILPASQMHGGAATQSTPPSWCDEGTRQPGDFLINVGLPMPNLNPERAMLIRVTVVD